MNYLITLRCPKKCSFCFSDKINSDMSFEKFQEYVDHAISNFPDHNIGILGGEPTVHPQFARMLHYAVTRRTLAKEKIKVIVFTNLMGAESNIAALQHKFRGNSELVIVWNCSEIRNLTPAQQELVTKRARALHKIGPKRITYSITYTPNADLTYLIDVMDRTQIQGARFAISASQTAAVAADDAIAIHLVTQLETLHRHGLRLYFDECGAVSAKMRQDLLARLFALSVTRTITQCPGPLSSGHCDVLPDGRLVPCMPFLATPTGTTFEDIRGEEHLGEVMRQTYPQFSPRSQPYDVCDAYQERPQSSDNPISSGSA